MKKLLAALLLVASSAFAQENGWAEIANGWGEIQTVPGFETMPAPSGCADTEVAIFLGTPPYLACADATYVAATKTLSVPYGTVASSNLTAAGLATPGSITVAPQGTGGVVTWTYKLVARLASGATTEAGAASSTAVGNATLDGTNFNRLTWSAVTGATDYVVYRTAVGTTPNTTGIIWTGTALTVDDTGLVGDGTTAPTIDGTGRVTLDGLTYSAGSILGHVVTCDAAGNCWPQAATGGISGLTAGRVTLSTAATTVGDDAGLLFDATNNRLSIVGGLPATDGTAAALGVTATLPASPSAAVSGVNVAVTSAGSAAQDQTAAKFTLGAGYTGASAAYGLLVQQSAAGTGTKLWPVLEAANFGIGILANPSTTGNAVGVSSVAANGNANGAGVGAYTYGGGGASSKGIGLLAESGEGGTRIAVVARLAGYPTTALPTVSAALLADNGTVAAPIVLFRDNGVTKVSIEDGGTLQFASPGITGGLTKTLTDASATSYATVALADGGTAAGEVVYRVVVTDGTSRQVLKGRFRYSAARVGVDYDADYNDVGTQLLSQKPDGGTLTCALTGAAAGGVLTLSANCDSSLTTPVLTLNYRFDTTNLTSSTITGL